MSSSPCWAHQKLLADLKALPAPFLSLSFSLDLVALATAQLLANALFGGWEYRPQIEYQTKAISPAGCPYSALLSPPPFPFLCVGVLFLVSLNLVIFFGPLPVSQITFEHSAKARSVVYAPDLARSLKRLGPTRQQMIVVEEVWRN